MYQHLTFTGSVMGGVPDHCRTSLSSTSDSIGSTRPSSACTSENDDREGSSSPHRLSKPKSAFFNSLGYEEYERQDSVAPPLSVSEATTGTSTPTARELQPTKIGEPRIQVSEEEEPVSQKPEKQQQAVYVSRKSEPHPYCSGCRTTHDTHDFSNSQLEAPDETRQCIGREGSFYLCRHKKITFADIERAVSQHLDLTRDLPKVIIQCYDRSHLRCTKSRSRLTETRHDEWDLIRPHIVAWSDQGAIRFTTYWEELVCHIPRDQAMDEKLLQLKLDTLQATSKNVLCRHLRLNDEILVGLAGGMDCEQLYETDGGIHDSSAALNSHLYCGGGGVVEAEDNDQNIKEKLCNMVDSRDQCDYCFSTSFGFRRWRGSVDARSHEVWLYGQSYVAFPDGLTPQCEIWRQRLD